LFFKKHCIRNVEALIGDKKMKTRSQIIFLTLLIIIGLVFNSCRTAQDHLSLFYKKGGKIENQTDTIVERDAIVGPKGDIQIVEHVTVVEKFTPYEVPRWKVRKDNRKYDDSLKFESKKLNVEVKKLKIEVQQNREDNRTAIKLKDKEIDSLKLTLRNNTKEARINSNSFKFIHILMVILALLGGFTIGRTVTKLF